MTFTLVVAGLALMVHLIGSALERQGFQGILEKMGLFYYLLLYFYISLGATGVVGESGRAVINHSAPYIMRYILVTILLIIHAKHFKPNE